MLQQGAYFNEERAAQIAAGTQAANQAATTGEDEAALKTSLEAAKISSGTITPMKPANV